MSNVETIKARHASPITMGTEPTVMTSWLAVTMVVAAGIIAALQVGKVIVSIPLLRTDLGLSLSAAGWALSIFLVLGVLGGILTSAIVSRFGDRRIMLVGLWAIAVGSLAGSFASDYPLLLATRVIEGLGFLLIIIAAPDLLRRIVAPMSAIALLRSGAVLCRLAWHLRYLLGHCSLTGVICGLPMRYWPR